MRVTALAQAAAIINGNPSHNLKLVGITGTNGKTTTTYLCFALAEANGEKAAMLTTVEYRIGEKANRPFALRPKRPTRINFCAKPSKQSCQMAVMETSSQAIDLHRCDCAAISKSRVFTNLTRDHLDYHETMENYFDAKKKLV